MTNSAFNLMKKQDQLIKNFAINKSSNNSSLMKLSQRILAEIMVFRRVPESTSSCNDLYCSKCTSPHLPQILSAVKQNKPITFILPAFPGKSPNPKKVLGHLPDFAEQLSLRFLGNLCLQIKKIYTPGIKIMLCSDGRVFSDVVGMMEHHVGAYQAELDNLIEEMALTSISTFNLDDFYQNIHFVQMRIELMNSYGSSLDVLRKKVRNGTKPLASPDEQEANRMYRGITRFLFEDAMHQGQTKSRTAIQKEAREKAYEVIRRSNAWSRLLEVHFPEAVRLSIHPQTCGAKKLGIRLIGNESWMTPWHGVAVENKNGYVLLKRSEAEALGATLMCSSNGRHSHYTLMTGV
ncbi:isocyanide synthase family protein [uncultured Legionella sp.]|uniref:isocyanide synthase family protein n=1 Tax=uncultured Legionella sp. TaxID=210934 RepID=UPI002637602C|nr:isocyanide synthase family protein [uncultured Legionella sp.]